MLYAVYDDEGYRDAGDATTAMGDERLLGRDRDFRHCIHEPHNSEDQCVCLR